MARRRSSKRRSSSRSSRTKKPTQPQPKSPQTPTDAMIDEVLEPAPETEQDRMRRQLEQRVAEENSKQVQADKELDRRLMPRSMRRYVD